MLTSVLRDSLGGNCTTTMIATLAADRKSLDVRMSIPLMLAVIQQTITFVCPFVQESISTCRFAQRVALISNEAVLNEELDPTLVKTPPTTRCNSGSVPRGVLQLD